MCTLPSSSSTTNFGVLPTDAPPFTPTNHNQTDNVPLAVGLTLGLLALVILVLGSVFSLYRRRRARGWTQFDFDAYPVPAYTAFPIMRRTRRKSSFPQDSKRPPPPARLSGPLMAMRDPDVFSNVSGLGPPPSYHTPLPSYDWRVDAA